MRYGYFVIADLKFPKGMLQRVGERVVNPDAFDDWPDWLERPRSLLQTARAHLAFFHAQREARNPTIELRMGKDEVCMRGILDRAVVEPWARALATFVRASAGDGAEGELVIAGDASAPPRGLRVRLAPGGARMTRLAPAMLTAIASGVDWRAATILEKLTART